MERLFLDLIKYDRIGDILPDAPGGLTVTVLSSKDEPIVLQFRTNGLIAMSDPSVERQLIFKTDDDQFTFNAQGKYNFMGVCYYSLVDDAWDDPDGLHVVLRHVQMVEAPSTTWYHVTLNFSTEGSLIASFWDRKGALQKHHSLTVPSLTMCK